MLNNNYTPNEHNDANVENPYTVQSTAKTDWSLILNNLPAAWALTPVLNKRPLRPNWQTESPIDKEDLIALMEKGQTLFLDRDKEWHTHWTGLGLRLGEVSDGTMAIDCDGEAAITRLREIIGGDLPHTVSWTSGKQGRLQLLIHVPQEYWSIISNKKIHCGNGEYLEMRWSGCQSVLPPSRHPETGSYTWINSPTDTPVMEAPLWLLNFFLQLAYEEEERRHAPIHNQIKSTNPKWDEIDWGRSYLAALSSTRADHYDTWVRVGMALHSIDDSLLGDWEQWSALSGKYQSGECARKWRSFKRGGVGIGTLAYMAKEDGWESPFKKEPNYSRNYQGKKGDTNGANHNQRTGEKPEPLSIEATRGAVTAILSKGLEDYEERHYLDLIKGQTVLTRDAFKTLEKNARCQLLEVIEKDLQQVDTLIKWGDDNLDWGWLLPSLISEPLVSDAELLCVDPVSIWQYLLPASLSVAGRRASLDLGSHVIPAIVWTCLVKESGLGKSRVESLVMDYLKRKDKEEGKRYKEELKEYEKATSGQGENTQELEPPQPRRHYHFDTATIQGVMKNLSEQGLNGSLWSKDELAGLFKSLSQFSKSGESEGLEILLTSWDGNSAKVTRVLEEDSYTIPATRLSIAGGMQPGIYSRVYKDEQDAQGLQARTLFAAPSEVLQKRRKGKPQLEEILPHLYDYIDGIDQTLIQLSDEADDYYTELVDVIALQASREQTAAIRAWTRKLPTNILRIAIGVHLIECFCDRSKDLGVLTKSTLEKAACLGNYYKNSFIAIQHQHVDNSSVESILYKIWDKGTKGELSPRDCYRSIKAIGRLAKQAGRDVGAYTLFLFDKLVASGRGIINKVGNTFTFTSRVGETVPSSTPPKTHTSHSVEEVPPIDVSPVETTLNKNETTTQTVSPPIQPVEVSPPISQEESPPDIQSEDVEVYYSNYETVEDILYLDLGENQAQRDQKLDEYVEPSPWDKGTNEEPSPKRTPVDPRMDVLTENSSQDERGKTPIPLEYEEEVKDFAAMLTEAVELGEKELIESVFDDLLWNDFKHIASRVWRALESRVIEELKRLSPEIYKVWGSA